MGDEPSEREAKAGRFDAWHTEIGGKNMSLKEFVAHEVETLQESELQAVAEYVSLLKFRARTSSDEARLSALSAELGREDRELAEAGLGDTASALSREDSL